MPFATQTYNFAEGGVSATMRNLSNTSLVIALTLLLSASFAQAFMFGLAGSPVGGPFGGQGAAGFE